MINIPKGAGQSGVCVSYPLSPPPLPLDPRHTVISLYRVTGKCEKSSEMQSKFTNRKLSLGWFLIMFVNFIIGVGGIIICTLKLKYVDDEEVKIGFFKLSIVFAACNLILSVLLLVSVLKSDQKYAFLYALLIFMSLFAATIHIESNSSKNSTFLIIFVVFALLCFLWFCVYGSYQIWMQHIKDKEEISEV